MERNQNILDDDNMLPITVSDDDIELQKQIDEQKNKLNFLDVHINKLKRKKNDDTRYASILDYSFAISFLIRQDARDIFGVDDLSKEFKMRNEKSFVKALIEVNSDVVVNLNNKWKSDIEIAHFIMQTNNIFSREIDEKLIKNREFVKKCIRDCNCPWLYETLSEEDKRDMDLVRELVMLDGYVYIHLEEEMKTHGDIMFQAVRQNLDLWQWIKSRFNNINSIDEFMNNNDSMTAMIIE